MKKFAKVALAAAAVACTAVAFAGCAPAEQTVTGEYKYENAWVPGSYYGVVVDVVVKGDEIVSVTCKADTETMHNISASWEANQNPGDLGHDATAAAIEEYCAKFVGAKVADVKALNVAKLENGQPDSDNGDASQGNYILTGATQTSGRIILAVQNALANL